MTTEKREHTASRRRVSQLCCSAIVMGSRLFCGMAGGIGVIAIAMGQHPSDKTVQANALNALRCIPQAMSIH